MQILLTILGFVVLGALVVRGGFAFYNDFSQRKKDQKK